MFNRELNLDKYSELITVKGSVNVGYIKRFFLIKKIEDLNEKIYELNGIFDNEIDGVCESLEEFWI